MDLHQTEIIVVGGGPIGLLTAYELLKTGYRVVIIDSGKVGVGSASGNAGLITSSHILPLASPGTPLMALKWMKNPAKSPFGIKPSKNPRFYDWLIRFSINSTKVNTPENIRAICELGRLSDEKYAQIFSTEKFECTRTESGVLNLYLNREEFRKGIRQAENLEKYGVPYRTLGRDMILEEESLALPEVVGGIRMMNDSSFDPAVFLSSMRSKVIEMGADCRENTKIVDLENIKGKPTVIDEHGNLIQGDWIVLAAGVFSSRFSKSLGVPIPLQPGRGISLTVDRSNQANVGNPVILAERKIAVTPMGNKLRCTGRMELGNLDPTPDPLWIERITYAVQEYLNLDIKTDSAETWAGFRPISPDGIPMIGHIPGKPGMILASGHHMLGLTHATGTAKIIYDLIGGHKTSFDITPFRLDRFRF